MPGRHDRHPRARSACVIASSHAPSERRNVGMRTCVDAGSLPRSDVDLQSVVGKAHPLGQPLAGLGVAPDLVGEMREVGAPYA